MLGNSMASCRNSLSGTEQGCDPHSLPLILPGCRLLQHTFVAELAAAIAPAEAAPSQPLPFAAAAGLVVAALAAAAAAAASAVLAKPGALADQAVLKRLALPLG